MQTKENNALVILTFGSTENFVNLKKNMVYFLYIENIPNAQ